MLLRGRGSSSVFGGKSFKPARIPTVGSRYTLSTWGVDGNIVNILDADIAILSSVPTTHGTVQ
jgi:hypothetical protein